MRVVYEWGLCYSCLSRLERDSENEILRKRESVCVCERERIRERIRERDRDKDRDRDRDREVCLLEEGDTVSIGAESLCKYVSMCESVKEGGRISWNSTSSE